MAELRREKPGLFDEFLALINISSKTVKKTQTIGRTIHAEDALVTKIICQVLVILGNKTGFISL